MKVIRKSCLAARWKDICLPADVHLAGMLEALVPIQRSDYLIVEAVQQTLSRGICLKGAQ